jgi:hypothetical protein
VAQRDESETSIRLLNEIVAGFVQRATVTEIPSEDPRFRSFILDRRPELHLVTEETDGSDPPTPSVHAPAP